MGMVAGYGETGTGRAGATRIDLVELAMPFFIVLDFFYGAFYNALPEGALTPVAAALFGGQTVLAGVSILARPNWWRWRLFFVITVLPFVWLTAHLVLRQEIDFPQMLRYLGGFYLGVLVLGHADRFPVRLVTWLACGAIVWVMVWSFSQPLYLHSGETGVAEPVPGWWASVFGNGRLAPYHGGIDNPHSSGYMSLALMMVVHQAWLAGLLRWQVMAGFVGLAMIYIIGCFSTQVLVGAVVYFGAYGMFSTRFSRPMKVIVVAAGVGGMLFILIENEQRKAEVRVDTNVKIEELGSGRLGTWMERLEIIGARPAGEIWLGTGIGSDNMSSIIWSLKETTSHNTYLTMIIENGIIGFFAYWGALVMMMMALGRTGICLFAPVFVTGMIGNGLSLRPMPFMMFFIAVSIAVWAMMRQAERSRRLADHRRRQKEQQMAEALSGRDGW